MFSIYMGEEEGNILLDYNWSVNSSDRQYSYRLTRVPVIHFAYQGNCDSDFLSLVLYLVIFLVYCIQSSTSFGSWACSANAGFNLKPYLTKLPI